MDDHEAKNEEDYHKAYKLISDFLDGDEIATMTWFRSFNYHLQDAPLDICLRLHADKVLKFLETNLEKHSKLAGPKP